VKSGEEARTALLDLHTDQRGRFMASRGLLSGDNFSLADFSRRQVGSGGLVILDGDERRRTQVASLRSRTYVRLRSSKK